MNSAYFLRSCGIDGPINVFTQGLPSGPSTDAIFEDENPLTSRCDLEAKACHCVIVIEPIAIARLDDVREQFCYLHLDH